MTFKKGQSGNPNGKPKGTAHNLAISAAKEAQKKYAIMPLDFFMTELNKVKNPMPWRLDCAKAAAPYVHRKMPIAIDGGEGKPLVFANAEALAKLTEAELNGLLVVMEKLGMTGEAE